MIYDKDFLLKLDKNQEREIFARITALTFQEKPVESIEGRVTTGSINVDGNSAVRRTCSLTIVSENFDYSNYYWGLNTKFKLEVGLKNIIDQTYPEIIWFPQGIFVLTSFNSSRSTNNFTLSLQGKDKMCLLNGEVGGNIESSVNFGIIEEVKKINGEKFTKITKIPIYEIIRNMIHEYAGEPYHNIIIKDLDSLGLELLEYRYDTPMYLYRDIDSNIYENVLFNGEKECEVFNKDGTSYRTILNKLTYQELEMLVDPLTGSSEPKIIKMDGNQYYVAKVEYGQTAGYRTTELVYAGDLIGNAGDTITSILDKIKNMLSDFEYFYNTEGQFIFQRKQTYVNMPWTPIIENTYVDNLILSSEYAYEFRGAELISSFNNNPNLLNLRNDYSIWGVRGEIPVHMRYAIDVKPTSYTSITVAGADDQEILNEYNSKYAADLKPQESKNYNTEEWDWREIIYQMAQDYYKYGHLFDDFEQRIISANKDLYPAGQTGYEQYYTDILSFWRKELYNPDPEDKEKENYFSETENYPYWNKTVYMAPEKLNFWFDFLDADGELSQFSASLIGSRPKVVNDNNVKSIYFRETPNVIFIENQSQADKDSAYTYIQIPNTNLFSISGQGKSAKDKLDELIYQHSYCIDTVTINALPIYYLNPNTKIYLFDEKTNLNGDYVISRMTIPLNYNGIMNITATKASKQIF